MKLVVILNVNPVVAPAQSTKNKISQNREYTRPDLKESLIKGFAKLADHLIFYDNFAAFQQHVSEHLDDLVLNFDFGFQSKTRNMTVPAFCESYGIQCFNPDSYVQVLCQDKFMTQKYVENFGIKTPKSMLVFAKAYEPERLADFTYPLIIKPNYESESIGITQNSIVANPQEAHDLLVQLFDTFDGLIVEEYIDGQEIAITIFQDENDSFLEEVELLFPETGDYKHKAYTIELKQVIEIPIQASHYLTNVDRQRLESLYKSLCPNKLVRVDARIRDGQIYIIEINANPGLYQTSIVPRTFKMHGYDYSRMFEKVFKSYFN